jgi:hypothetical protein
MLAHAHVHCMETLNPCAYAPVRTFARMSVQGYFGIRVHAAAHVPHATHMHTHARTHARTHTQTHKHDISHARLLEHHDASIVAVGQVEALLSRNAPALHQQPGSTLPRIPRNSPAACKYVRLMYKYVCIYVHIYIRAHTHTHTCADIHSCVCILHTHTWMYMYVYRPTIARRARALVCMHLQEFSHAWRA